VNLSKISELVKPIRDRWIAAGATPRDGATPEDLARFESRYGVALPADFATFYRAIDGMPPNEMDDEMIRWWPIDEVKPVNDDLKQVHDAYPNQFIFADWSLWAHAFAIDLSKGSNHGRVVIAGMASGPIPLSGSFGEFLDLYVRKSRDLYGPEQPIPRSDAMAPPPTLVGGARVVRWAVIDDRQRSTGGCRQVVAGRLQGPAAGLAICQYDGEDAFYLFGCDGKWNTVTDTWHETLEDAMKQAEFEYEGISATWNAVS
jgi:hypothetical protein